MVKRYFSYNVIQLVHMINTNYKKYKSYNDVTNLDNKPTPAYRTKYVRPVIHYYRMEKLYASHAHYNSTLRSE